MMIAKRLATWIPILFAAVVFYATSPTSPERWVHAEIIEELDEGTGSKRLPLTVDENGFPKRCADYDDAKGGAVLGKLIPCIVHTMESRTITFTREMSERFGTTLYAFMTLVVTLFGVKVLQGEQRIGAQAFLLLFKITMVIAVLEMMPAYTDEYGQEKPGLISSAYASLAAAVEITSGALVLPAGVESCDTTRYGNDETPILWKNMDCMLGKMFGFMTGRLPINEKGEKPVNMILASSLVGLLTGFLFGGTYGVAVFFALIGVLWSFVALILRTAMAVLNGYLIISLMAVLAPIFLPLSMLKVTSDYFERWWKIILGGVMLPVVISAYAMFALNAYSMMFFSPDSMLQSLTNKSQMQDAKKMNRKLCDAFVSGNPDDRDQELFEGNALLENIGSSMLTGVQDLCANIEVPVLDITKVKKKPESIGDLALNKVDGVNEDPRFENAREALWKLFIEGVKLFIMAWVLSAGMSSLQGVVSSFTGSGVSRAVFDAKSDFEKRIEGAFDNARHKMESEFSTGPKLDDKGKPMVDEAGRPIYESAKDGEFIKRLPFAVSSAGRQFAKEAKLFDEDKK